MALFPLLLCEGGLYLDFPSPPFPIKREELDSVVSGPDSEGRRKEEKERKGHRSQNHLNHDHFFSAHLSVSRRFLFKVFLGVFFHFFV